MLQVATGSSIVPVNDGTGLITALHYVDYPLPPHFFFRLLDFLFLLLSSSPSAPSSPFFLIPPASVIPVSLPLADPFLPPPFSPPRRFLPRPFPRPRNVHDSFFTIATQKVTTAGATRNAFLRLDGAGSRFDCWPGIDWQIERANGRCNS